MIRNTKKRKTVKKSYKGLGDIYRPLSKSASLKIDTPDSMSYEIHGFLTKLEKTIGNIDKFVLDRLKYKNIDELYSLLSAEQIDAVALAIYNIEYKGEAIIIGDQTGIGKGRVAASMIRYGIENGYKPIFITEKPNLFSDLYRDLIDIKSQKYKPFILNARDSKTMVKDKQGNIIFEPLDSKNQTKIINSLELPNSYDYVLATYSQLSAGATDAKGNPKAINPKIEFLKSISEGNTMILDESHNASGDSNTGKTLKDIVSNSEGVTFLSATFAKRPDNMPIYAMKTAIREANLTPDDLTLAITKGGVALQEVIASQLVGQGQMIRRERTFNGIEVNYLTADSKANEQRKIADNITEIMRMIIEFQQSFVNPEIEQLDKIAASYGSEVSKRKGTKNAGVDNTPYFSKIFQSINQLLFSIKADSVADRAIFRLKQGKSVVIAFASTMESFVTSLTDDEGKGVGPGTKVKADFANVLLRGLEGVLRYTETDIDGKKSYSKFDIKDFSQEAQNFYQFIEYKITNASTGISISPIDQIKEKLEKNGFKVAEVTGRKYELKFTNNNSGNLFATIENRKVENVNDAFRNFNDNKVDVLMINQSGSTGASAHAIPTALVPESKVKQRVMIVLQAELDINTEVQKRGRINRTGQIKLPIYDYISSAIPAEKRLMMMLQKKLKSLDANTTSNQKNSEAILKSDDFLNKYGNEVVYEYLLENPEFNTQIGDPFNIKEAKSDSGKEPIIPENAAHKVSGRVAVLSTKMQEDFYNEIISRYQNYVELLVQQGEYDLEVEIMNLKAETLSREILVANNGGKSPFAQNTYLEKCEINTLKKPYTAAEIKTKIDEVLGKKTPKSYSDDLINEAKETILDRFSELLTEKETFYNQKEKGIKDEKGYKKFSANDPQRQIYYLERIKELKEAKDADVDKLRNRYDYQLNTLRILISFFQPGKNINFMRDANSEMGSTFGVSLGFKFGNNKKNKFTPSNISLVIALASSTKQLSIPLSGKTEKIAFELKGSSLPTVMSIDSVLAKWQSEIKNSSKDRTIRYIVTGNILQFYGQSDVPRAKLIQFTTIDSKVRKGALLPESYEPKNGTADEQKITVPVNKLKVVVQSLPSLKALECTSNLTIVNDRNGISLVLPSSNRLGGYVYLNKNLISAIGSGFYSQSNKMVVNVPFSNLQAVLDVLGNELKISASISKIQFSQISSEFSNNGDLQDEVRPIVKRKRESEAQIKQTLNDKPNFDLKLLKAKLELEMLLAGI